MKDDLKISFLTKENDVDYLVLSKSWKPQNCNEVTIQGITVCRQAVVSYTVECYYPLSSFDVTNELTVIGQDVDNKGVNEGKLMYKLEVDDSVLIGQQASFSSVSVHLEFRYLI